MRENRFGLRSDAVSTCEQRDSTCSDGDSDERRDDRDDDDAPLDDLLVTLLCGCDDVVWCDALSTVTGDVTVA